MLTLSREQFPDSLNNWHDAQELFCEGDPRILTLPCISVIGTRSVSEVGARRAAAITRLLARAKYCIVSGLAEGVDAITHDIAMSVNAKTIAVIGTPIDRIYPAKNEDLWHQIAANGLIVSQFPIGTKVFKSNFPKRNRLMAALCQLTVVVEASEQSGTRHQVKTAIELGRAVALPVSLAESGFPWVIEAMKSGNVHVLRELRDLSTVIKKLY